MRCQASTLNDASTASRTSDALSHENLKQTVSFFSGDGRGRARLDDEDDSTGPPKARATTHAARSSNVCGISDAFPARTHAADKLTRVAPAIIASHHGACLARPRRRARSAAQSSAVAHQATPIEYQAICVRTRPDAISATTSAYCSALDSHATSRRKRHGFRCKPRYFLPHEPISSMEREGILFRFLGPNRQYGSQLICSLSTSGLYRRGRCHGRVYCLGPASGAGGTTG